jgi:GntR family transcriptional regulator/MocR family aminotransferase
MPEPTSGRGARSPALHLTIDPASDLPLYRQVYDGLREAILAGRLPPGARLPATRELAKDLAVSRNTVLVAFEQLRSEGYLVGRRGGGTHVRAGIPDVLLRVPKRRESRRIEQAAAGTRVPTGVSAPGKPAGKLSARGTNLVERATSLVEFAGLAPVPFQLGLPATDAFPARVWSRLGARRWRLGNMNLGHADPAGEVELRQALASYVTTARGAHCTPDNVLVVNGAQQALHLIAQVLLDPGDSVWIEDPGYGGAQAAFVAAGARIVPVRVDNEGLDVGAGEEAAGAARLAYVTPSHQYPLGSVMSAARRLRLLAWARRAGAYIIEDDYDSEFRFAGRPLPCLQGLDTDQSASGHASCVLYVGTLSKTLVPGLRLGYMVVPDHLVDALRAARAALDRHTSTTDQAVLADFIGLGHYARHVRRVRNLCAERQAALVTAIASTLGELLSVNTDAAGLHVVGRLPGNMDDRAASRAAAAEGVRAAALSTHRIAPPSPSPEPGGLLLGYGGFDERRIRWGVDRLHRALTRMHQPS